MAIPEVPQVKDFVKQPQLARAFAEKVSGILNWLFMSGQITRTGNNPLEYTIAGTGIPASPNKAIQWNNSGSFGGSVHFEFDVAKLSVVQGDNNTATGLNAFAQGDNSVASGFDASAQGSFCTASGQYTHAEGLETLASGDGAHAEGQKSVAAGFDSHAEGFNCVAGLSDQHASSDGGFDLTVPGQGQYSTVSMSIITTDATPTNLAIGGGLGFTGLLAIRSNFTYGFTVTIVGRDITGANSLFFIRKGLIHNEAGTTSLIGAITTIGTDSAVAGWAVVITADNTNDCLQIQVTGAAATTIRWFARIDLVEVGNT